MMKNRPVSASTDRVFMPGNNFASDLRGLVIIIVIAYIFSSPFRIHVPFIRRFFPGAGNILAALTALYTWPFVIYIRSIFVSRERFEELTEEHSGDELVRILHEDASLVSEADLHTGKLMQIYAAELIVAVILSVICSALGIALPFPLFAFVVFFFFAAVFIFALLGLFRSEQYYAGEGISLPEAERAKRIAAMGFFTVFAGVPALLFSLGKNILPWALIGRFFAWLLSLLPRLKGPAQTLPPPAPETSDGIFMPVLPPELQELAQNSEPWPFWDYLKYFAIAIIILLFAGFMVKPLFDRSLPGGFSLGKRLSMLFAFWFRSIKEGIRSFLYFIRNGEASVPLPPGRERIRRLAEDLGAAWSPAKRKEMKKNVTLFARLIIWGTDVRQVIWKANYGPGEYCGVLASSFPPPACDSLDAGIQNSIIRCGALFEEALYGAQILSNEKQEEFRSLVEEITENRGF
ncbi:MAG: hypothetical protein LBG22_04565 [Treponema sp.]|jgi:hypothetical protein|nr:hypothetical protein [Treponema sp.]